MKYSENTSFVISNETIFACTKPETRTYVYFYLIQTKRIIIKKYDETRVTIVNRHMIYNEL